MRTDETDLRIALQPETQVEQALLAELFARLSNLSTAPEHPEKVGTEQVFYTLDVSEFDLDLDLWESAECNVNQHGRLDPEPGSRALVVIHGDDPRDPDGEPEVVYDDSQPTEEDIDEAVEAVATAEEDPDDNEYTENVDDLLGELMGAAPLEDREYGELQRFAKRVSTTGVMDIPANQSTDDLIDDLTTFAERATGQEEA